MDRDTRNILNSKQPNLFSHGEVSTDGLSDGQITISKGSNQQTALSLKKDGRIYKTNMSSDGNQYVDKDLKVNGNINLSNKLIIKNYPAFGVYQSSSADAQQIENNAYETIVFDTKLYDNGDDFSTSNYSFTAPLNGIYHFNARILWDANESLDDGDWAAEDYNQISLVKNDRTSVPDSADIVALERDTIQGAVTDVYLSNRIVSDLRLDAGDYISVAVKHVTAAGHSQYTYAPTNPYMWTSLTGHLVCAL